MKTHLLAAAALAVFAILPAAASESKAPPAMDHSAHCGLPMGEGSVVSLDVARSSVTLKHQPIASLGWPDMTMAFAAGKGIDLSAFAPGDTVHFLLAGPAKDDRQTIIALCGLDVSQGLHDACMGKMHETAMKAAADAGEACTMEGMDHSAMPGMDHGKMQGMDHSAMKPADAEAMDCKEQCPMMRKSSGADPAQDEPAAAQDHSQH